MGRRPAGLLLAPLLLAAACTGSDSDADSGSDAPGGKTAPESSAELQWGECGLEVPDDVDLECGTLTVPADRADPGSGTVQLAFGVVRTDAEDPADDPLVYLSGGPGQGALEAVAQAFEQLYAPLAGDRELILLDQRGTGLSEPSLACDEYTSWARSTLGAGLADEELATQAVEALEECRQRLVDDGVDLTHYDSAASAADLEDLRLALGHEQWNLYGVSYGTRLAQTAVRDFPDGIRSVVLDAAYPVDADLYAETPGNAVRAMDALFAACAADPGCAEQHPDLGQRFRDLVARLDAAPAPISVPDLTTGERIDEELDGAALAGFLFQSLYSTELLAFLPETIAAAEAGEYGTVALLLGAQVQQLDLISIGQQLAVQCQEEVPFGTPEEVARAAAEDPLVRGFFEVSPLTGPGIFDLCASWGGQAPDPVENEPVVSDVPALVLAGELDPITPPRWGEDVVAGLAAGTLVRFPSTGHGSLPSHDCAAEITAAFLAAPEEAPDTGCVEDVPPPAFTTEAVDAEMTAFEDEGLGLAGRAPQGWLEVFPGLWQESPLVVLTQQVVPGATAEQVLGRLATLRGTAAPEPVDRVSTDALDLDLYRFEDLGQWVELALADTDDGLVLVQLTTTPARADVYREAVFLPAVEALTPA
ncbi:alpha/beta fold hydrolase [Trujillonella humicola]|uniref:alpha/beta fold hydrolase n=1 Tax=Trujillonella humicola TaxID=3383699 RepID=UPI00390657CD